MPDSSLILANLLDAAEAFLPRSHAPYSGRTEAAVLLLSDGTWVPGVRVESASFSLSIPAVLNAVTTAVAAGRTDLAALVTTGEATPAVEAYLKALPIGPWRRADGGWVRGTTRLPEIGDVLHPFADPPGAVVQKGIEAARKAAEHAWTPESDFPVGAVLVSADGRAVAGANVEHPDWSGILCAERNAVGTAVTYGLTDLHTLFLSCAKDRGGTPCGACRQVLAEQAPDVSIWMDRHAEEPERSTPSELLPHAFSGTFLNG